MKTQKFIITEFDHSGQERIQRLLDDGYKIVSMEAEQVSRSIAGGSFYDRESRGKLAVVLEKD